MRSTTPEDGAYLFYTSDAVKAGEAFHWLKTNVSRDRWTYHRSEGRTWSYIFRLECIEDATLFRLAFG